MSNQGVTGLKGTQMKNGLLYLYALLAMLTLTNVAVAQVEPQWDGWMHPGIGWGGMMFGGFMMVAFWGGIVFLIVLLLRGNTGAIGASRRQRAIDIANERLARGEIDDDAYDAIVSKIKG